MQTGRASRTAEAAAILRAMHRHIDDAPPIFDDAAVESLLPTYARRFLARLDALPQSWQRVYRQRRGGLAQMRAQIVVRARYAEDALQRASRRGIGQYLILAAGLDTYALRDTCRAMPVFEVDHPATQQWKREKLRAVLEQAKLATLPEHLEFVPVDFERESLNQALGASTFASATPAFISWLGTTYYLRERALRDTLTALSGLCAAGSELVLDYWSRATLTDAGAQALLAGTRVATALLAEPMRSLIEPAAMERLVNACGWRVREHCAASIADARYLADRADGLTVPAFSYLMHLEI
jgi:methyltransferase (TIGR00027 family)